MVKKAASANKVITESRSGARDCRAWFSGFFAPRWKLAMTSAASSTADGSGLLSSMGLRSLEKRKSESHCLTGFQLYMKFVTLGEGTDS